MRRGLFETFVAIGRGMRKTMKGDDESESEDSGEKTRKEKRKKNSIKKRRLKSSFEGYFITETCKN